jgi:hypothetical protein
MITQSLFLMLAGHALADYPLQGDWLAKAKNHKLDLVPGESIWYLALWSHALIHALAVFLATGSPMLAFFEQVAHMVIDYAKCDGRIGYNTDQGLHIACKVVWFVLLIVGLA